MKVLIVDDQVLFAEAIAMALRNLGVDVVGMVDGSEAALATVHDPDRRPDIVLMDIGLPEETGLALGARILRADHDVRVVALTARTDAHCLQEAMRIGFSGYLTKDTQVSRLVASLRTVLEGEVVIPRTLARGVAGSEGIDRGRRAAPDDSDAALLAAQLTDRELEVLQLLAEGATSNDIAVKLRISRNTVRTHVQSILGKLGAHSRLEAAAFAVRHGLVSAGGGLGASA